MRIGILTLPLNTNYGGILQAYALQTVLRKNGYDAMQINIVHPNRQILNISKIITKNILKKYLLGRKDIKSIIPLGITKKDKSIISRHTLEFIQKYINPTSNIYNTKKKLKKIGEHNYDALIVGSDQVWRKIYARDLLYTYFFDFISEERIRKVAYGASFGVSEWQFTKSETKKLYKLIKKFDAVSVREDSGVELCEKYFDINPLHVIDPTMLLDAKEYVQISENEGAVSPSGDLLVYYLDQDNERKQLIQIIEKEKGYAHYSIEPKNEVDNESGNLVYPPVTDWIKGFIEASFVLTDSFHGVVFSILFNKPFIVYGNIKRGMTRVSSLLNMFELTDRLILSINDLTIEKLNENIDYKKINGILKYERQKAISFLFKALMQS